MNKALYFNEDSLITSQSSNIRIVLIQKVLMQLQRGTNDCSTNFDQLWTNVFRKWFLTSNLEPGKTFPRSRISTEITFSTLKKSQQIKKGGTKETQ